MKLLLDQNVSYRLINKLDTIFPGSTQVRIAGLEGAVDVVLWQFAKENDFAIVTKDSDFHELSLIRGFPPKVVWLKSGNTSSSHVLAVLLNNRDVILSFLKDTENGCLELH